MAAAAAAVFGMWGTHAQALALGQIVVLSALGEPLRAEVDIPEINAEEESSLRTTVAAPDAFRIAGLEYDPALVSLQISLQKKADGHPFLRISSERVINAPFVDLILEAHWASGRIVSTYTMLFDPPNLRLQAVTPTVPQISPMPATAAAPIAAPAVETSTPIPAATAPVQTTPVSTAAAVAGTAVPAPVSAPEPAMSSQPSPEAAAQPPAKPAPSASRVTIKSGDTASRIAMAHQLPGVSLDQMLVAMLRANPDAVILGNINRIRAGAVLRLPSAEQAQAIPSDQARQVVVAQSKDFNDFRQKLAASAPVRPVATAERRASGSVQASVKDRKLGTAAPDKLTLSKAAAHGKTREDEIATDHATKEAAVLSERVSKNIAELTKLEASVASASPVPTATPTQPAAATPMVPAPAVATTAPTPGVVASVPAKHPMASLPVPAREPSLLDELADNPLIPFAAAGFVAALTGFGFYRIRQRKKANQMDDDSTLDGKAGLKRNKK